MGFSMLSFSRIPSPKPDWKLRSFPTLINLMVPEKPGTKCGPEIIILPFQPGARIIAPVVMCAGYQNSGPSIRHWFRSWKKNIPPFIPSPMILTRRRGTERPIPSILWRLIVAILPMKSGKRLLWAGKGRNTCCSKWNFDDGLLNQNIYIL